MANLFFILKVNSVRLSIDGQPVLFHLAAIIVFTDCVFRDYVFTDYIERNMLISSSTIK